MHKGLNGFGQNLILVKASDDKSDKVKKDKKDKSSRGGGIAACLNLMKQLLDFQELITECADAQDMDQNKQKIEAFNTQLDQMYSDLIEMAKSGRTTGETPAVQPEAPAATPEVTPEVSEPSGQSGQSESLFTVNAPEAPKMP